MPNPLGRGASGLPGNPNMMKQLQALQERMVAEQEALGQESVEVSVGGGAVTVTMSGHQKLTEVRIRPELLAPDEHDMLAELLIAAVNQAVERSQAMAAERMGSLTKGLGLPPGLGF